MSSFDRFCPVDSAVEAILRRESDGMAEVFSRRNAIGEDCEDEENETKAELAFRGNAEE